MLYGFSFSIKTISKEVSKIMNSRGISPIVGVLMLIVFIVITAGVLTNPAILSKLKGETPPNTILDVSAVYYSNTNELKLILTHKGGDPLDLRKVKITVSSKEGSEKLNLKFGSGLISLKGYYYRLDTSATNPNSHNPDDIVFSELVFVKDEESINYHWGRDGPSETLKDYFGVNWTGQLKVEESGEYTFYLTSDDGSWLWIDGKLVIDNGGLHAAKTVSAKVYLSKGVHEIRVKMFEWGGDAVCILEWEGKNVTRQIIPKIKQISKYILTVEDSVSFPLHFPAVSTIHVVITHIPSSTIIFKKDITVRTSSKAFLKGLKAYYYTDEFWSKLANVTVEERIWYADSTSGWQSDIPDWPKPIIGKTDSFSVKWVGYLYVPGEGDYIFYLTSDDGSWLYIDGQLVINNGGLHGPKEESATVHLTKGYHQIEVKMFEHYGGAVIRLEWEKKQTQTPVKEFLNATWKAYYYTNENWQNLANTTVHSRIRFADYRSGWQSDIPNWPQPIIGETDTFSVNFSADVYLPEGDYTFYLISDDGSWLWIDGKLVVDNSGLHPPRERSGSVHLSEGTHHFEVKMFEHYGGAVVYLQYSSGVFGRQPVTSFYHVE